MEIPRLYPILDVDCLLRAGVSNDGLLNAACEMGRELSAGGCTLLQFRAKALSGRETVAIARELRRVLPSATLIMNDRADLSLAAGFDGVHVGQDDLSPAGVRTVVGDGRIVGLSTHNALQFSQALSESVNYLAIGPVFSTGSKLNPDPVVGLDGVREARRLLEEEGSGRPLVAIGGVTRENAMSVISAGADAIAVISDLVANPRESAQAFFRLML